MVPVEGPNDGTCPCMDPNALPRRIRLGISDVGIVGLTEIMKVAHELGLSDEFEIKKELLEKVRKRNWVPEEAQDKYAEALYREYVKTFKSD
jgi:hypothetical protein